MNTQIIIHFLDQNTNLIIIVLALVFCSIIFSSYISKKIERNKRAKTIATIPSVPPKNNATVITSQDLRAIAGDDVIVTQLDLARAYIELGKKKLAKQILEHVLNHGNSSQQQDAERLISIL